MTSHRRSFLPRPPVLDVESMDIDDLVIAALTRCRDVEQLLYRCDLVDFDDPDTLRCIGNHMAAKTGIAFRIGRRILQLLSPGGYLMPPPEFRLSRQTEPTEQEMFEAPIVTPYRVDLWQSGGTPAEWRINGTVYHRDWGPRIWSRILYLNRPYGMTLTDEGWVRLGRRI